MDNPNLSKNRANEYLGVNKIGKQIRKSPLHQPNFVNNGSGNNNTARQQPQPQVYNISKSDFRSIVQQLTGSPSRQDPLPRPPNNPPKHPSMRLQRIRPPPLTPINRTPIPPVVSMQPPPQGPPMAPPMIPFNNNNNNNFGMPPPQFGQPSPRGMQPLTRGGSDWANPALSPISAYMQQLQSCIGDGGPMRAQPTLYQQVPGPFQPQSQMQPRVQGQSQPPPQMHPQVMGQSQAQPPMQPQFPGQAQGYPPTPPLPSPRTNGPPPLPSPTSQFLLPSPRSNGAAPLSSPTSQFLLPSPSGYFNLLSPTSRSPYPLLSPGSQFPPPLSPNFTFSPMGQSGFLGPGPQPPLSPGMVFPLSPTGFNFPISRPRWRDY